MKKQQVDHVLRAAGRITGETQFIIIGSQALHGKYPDIADQILKSAEVDLVAGKRGTRAEWLNAIGHLSPFHGNFGYYADPVDLSTATLPKGWKGRLVNLPAGDTEGVKGLCLEPHDLAISKYAAGREKDQVFTRADRLSPRYARAVAPAIAGLSGYTQPQPRGHHSAAVAAIDRLGNIAGLVHSINSPIFGDTGIVVQGVPISGVAGIYQCRVATLKPGGRLPGDMAPVSVVRNGKPVMAVAAVGSSRHFHSNR